MKWYIQVIRKYAQFSGRSRRTEYWMFVLFNLIFTIIAAVLDHFFGLSFGDSSVVREGAFLSARSSGGVIQTIYALFVLIPALAVLVRRLHDINKSGKYVLWILVPIAVLGLSFAMNFGDPVLSELFLIIAGILYFLCIIILLIWLCIEGTPGDNRYGSNPKEFRSDLSDFGGVFDDEA